MSWRTKHPCLASDLQTRKAAVSQATRQDDDPEIFHDDNLFRNDVLKRHPAMAQVTEKAAPPVGQKRGPGRPPKSANLPPAKKQKLAAPPSPKETTPQSTQSVDSPASEKKPSGLPAKVSAVRPLPTLRSPQSPGLPDLDYASIAASAVLALSLERSRAAWTQTGVFERYWVKPETGKHARPPPPSNPDIKSMKTKGRCRLRIEPHIFEVEVFVVDKPRPPPPPKQYISAPQAPGSYGYPYRPTQQSTPVRQQQQWHGQDHQNRTAPPANQPAYGGQTPSSATPPVHHRQMPAPALPAQPSPSSSPAPGQQKKASADPVIGLLAARAGSDPELKALMREVATGKASQDQLKIFQRHIDELTAVIQAQKAKDEEEERKRANQSRAKYEAATEGRAATQAQPTQQHPRPYAPPQQIAYTPPQPYVPPPPPPPGEVVFAFTTPDASGDRFLFPQHCILELLTPQHMLASFMVARKGRSATGLEADEEHWTPITLMVEVAYGRERILADVQRWVKSADDVREHMKAIMERCERAPDEHLAFRLPFKGLAGSEFEGSSHGASPVPFDVDEKKRKKRERKMASLSSALKNESTLASEPTGADEKTEAKPETLNGTFDVATSSKEATSLDPENGQVRIEDGKKDGPVDSHSTTEGRRSTRSTRKSVRISEG